MFKIPLVLVFIGKCICISLLPFDFYNALHTPSEVVLLDVRILEDYQAGHIEGAQWAGSQIVLDSLMFNYNKEAPVLIYCDYGQRSKTVIKLLKRRGYKQIIELEGGIDLWSEQGFPLTSYSY